MPNQYSKLQVKKVNGRHRREGLTTTIQVYSSDRDWLQDRYGGVMKSALHALITEVCKHPEGSRVYQDIRYVTYDDGKATENHCGGFLCADCRHLVLTDTVFDRSGMEQQ